MNSVVLLASLLASAHGFASSPITGGVKCSANEEKFFVYSVDPSLVYPFVASLGGPDYTSNETVSRGLVGKTWQGVHMSITQANITITQASGKPLTVTSPNTLQTGGFNVLSENFCLGYGNWTVKLTAPTHPEMASYVNPAAVKQLTLEERRTPGAPINAVPVQPQALVDWAVTALNNVNVNNFSNSPMCKSDGTNCIVLAPFATRWAIFPAVMRAKAEAEAAKGPFGMAFLTYHANTEASASSCQVDYETNLVVSAAQPVDSPVDTAGRRRLHHQAGHGPPAGNNYQDSPYCLNSQSFPGEVYMVPEGWLFDNCMWRWLTGPYSHPSPSPSPPPPPPPQPRRIEPCGGSL